MKANRIKPKIKIFVGFHIIVLALIIVLLLCFRQAPGNNVVSPSLDAKTSADSRDRRTDEIRKQMTESASANFSISLEMKENVDFVLTPALLVQEAISEDVVITYPSE